MHDLLSQIRSELTAPEDKYPWLVYVIAGSLVVAPLSLLGDGLADVVISIAAGLFVARSLLERDFAWVRETWIAIALVLWIYMIARGLLSVDPERSAVKALVWIRFIVLGAALQFALARSVALQKALLYAIVAMAVFGAADTLFQFAVGHDIFGREIAPNRRLTGPLQNPSIGLLLLFGGLPAIVYLFQRIASDSKSGDIPFVPLGLLTLIYAAIILSGERMVFIQAVAVFALLLLLLFRPPLRMLAGLSVAALVLLAGLLVAFPQIRERHLSTITQLSNPTASIYGKAMLAGIEVIKDHPIFGVGLKNFKANCPQAVEDAQVADACRLIHPHQVWLHITSETGLLGAAGFLAMFAIGLWPAVRLWRTWAVEPLLAGATIAVLVRLAPFATSGNFFSNWREAMFWLLFGIAAAMARIRWQQSDASRSATVSPSDARAQLSA